MAEPLRHRQTKGAATDMLNLKPLRHTPTLRIPAGRSRIAVMAGQGKIGARLEPMPDAMLPAGCGARTVNRSIGPMTIFALSAGRDDDIFTPSRKECERLHRQKQRWKRVSCARHRDYARTRPQEPVLQKAVRRKAIAGCQGLSS